MADPLVVVGAGGFGRETLDVVEAINTRAKEPVWRLLGVMDDGPSDINAERLAARGVAYLGSVADGLAERPAAWYSVGIGSPETRRKLVDRFEYAGWSPATLIHPDATVGSRVEIGAGTVVCAGARLTTNITLGRHVHLNPNVTVGHDTTLGDFVSLNPAASVSGDCVVEDGVLIGVGGVVINAVRVGEGAIVGAGACVVRDVTPRSIVKGVPAR